MTHSENCATLALLPRFTFEGSDLEGDPCHIKIQRNAARIWRGTKETDVMIRW